MPDSTLKQFEEMTDANQFLARWCQKTLDDIAQQVRGCSHSVNRCNAEYASLEDMTKAHADMEKKLSDAYAEIGKLQERVASLEVSMEKSREAYKELKKGG